MSEIVNLKDKISKIKAVIDNPKTDAATKRVLQSALEKGEKKLAELQRVNKMESSNKELTDAQEKKADQVKESSSALASALKQKVAAAKAKIAKTKPKPTTKKKKGVSVAKAKNIAKKIRGNQRLSQSDPDIESDAKRFAINKTKRVSQGGRANQYGTKAENKGGVYYEKRDNRYDRQNKKYAKLEDGGMMARGGRVMDDVDMYLEIHGYYPESVMALRGDGIGQSIVRGDRSKFELSGEDYRKAEEMGYEFDYYANGWVEKDDDDDYAKGGMMAKGGSMADDNKKLTTLEKKLLEEVIANYDEDDNMCFTRKLSQQEKGVMSSLVKKGLVYDSFEGEQGIGYDSHNYFPTEMADGGMMAKGGMTEHGLRNGDKIIGGKTIGTTIRVRNEVFDEDARVDLSTGKRTILTYNAKTKKWDDKMADGGAIAELNRGLNSDFRFDINSENFAKGGSMADDAVEISGFGKNIMGTLDITMRLKAMRKPQEFIVYPVSMGDKEIMIQSDTRIGTINMSDGTGKMSQSHPNGAYGVHFSIDKLVPFKLTDSQLSELKSQLAKTAGKEVGTKGVISNNEGAAQFMAQGGLTEHGLQVGDRIVRMTDDPYTIVVDNMGVEAVVDLNEGTRKGGQGTRFMSSGMMASGGEVHLKKKIDDLTGKRVHYEALGGVGGSFQIQSATVSPEFYSKRYVHIHSKGGGVDSFPLSELDEFMKGREVEVRDSKGEPYTLQLLSKMEDGGSIISEDTVARIDDPRLADVSAYMEGGELKDVGGTQFSTRDLSGMFANGGVVSYVGKDDRDQSYFRRYNGAVGSFQWQIDGGKNRGFAEGILYPLNDFDTKYYSHIKLKDGEVLLRYKTDRMRSVNPNRGEGEYLIKINLDNGMIYFMSDSDDDDDKNPKFETRGIKAKYIRITSDYAKKLEDGGNLEMVKNQAVEVGHHSEELKDALKKDPKVDAWVVSKMGNLTGELSDVTHYLDGQTKSFMSGGMLNKSVNDNLKLYLYEKKGSPMHQWMVKTILAAALTDANFHSASKKAETIFPEAKFTESVQYSKLQEESLIDRLEEKGREIARLAEWDGEQIINAISFYTSMNMGHPLGLKVASLKNSMADGGMMASGGGVYEEYRVMIQYPSENQKSGWASFDSIDIIVQANSREMAEKKALSNFKKTHPNKKGKVTNIITTASNNFSKMFNQSKLKDGGMMSKGGKIGQRGVTYFIGKPEVDVIGRFNKKRATWNTCKIDDNGNKNFSSYTKTFYGGSAKIPSDGIKITKKEFDKLDFSKADTMAEGGMMAKGGELKEGDFIRNANGTRLLVSRITKDEYYLYKFGSTYPSPWGKKKVDDYIATGWWTLEPKEGKKTMGMGGKVKFSDKVKSISKSLLKRKKVSPSVQKDYGKTYSKKEAVESAKRIAGAMRKKETAKKKR